jgi:hypothetical protein
MKLKHESAAAVCEWTIAVLSFVSGLMKFIFDFYIFSLVYDIRPAVRTSKGYRKRHHLEDQPLPDIPDAMSDRARI